MADQSPQENPLSLELALEQYPNLTIKRWVSGNVTIWEKLEGDSEREISLRLHQGVDTEEWDMLYIDAKTTPQLTREQDSDRDTALRIKLQGEDGLALLVRDRGESHDPLEIMGIARNGLDLLDAFLQADPKLQLKYKDRILDSAGNPQERLKEFPQILADFELGEELRKLGVTSEETDPLPEERYKFMKKMLRKPIVSTTRN